MYSRGVTRLSPLVRIAIGLSCGAVVACGRGSATDTSSQESGSQDESAETGNPEPDCTPVLQSDGQPSGFVECASSGQIFREEAVECVTPWPNAHLGEGISCSAGYGTCSSDEDCAAEPFGVCEHLPYTWYCECVYGCTNDDQCGADSACICSPVEDGSRCVDAECRVDADCDEGERCTVVPGEQDYTRMECRVPGG